MESSSNDSKKIIRQWHGQIPIARQMYRLFMKTYVGLLSAVYTSAHTTTEEQRTKSEQQGQRTTTSISHGTSIGPNGRLDNQQTKRMPAQRSAHNNAF